MTTEQQIRSYWGDDSFDRVKIALCDQINLAAIDQGAIFIFAAWSGTSMISFKLLSEALTQSPSTFPIYVVDIDTIDHEVFRRICGKPLLGNGETVWIRKGKIIGFDIGYTNQANQALQYNGVLPERIRSLALPEFSVGDG